MEEVLKGQQWAWPSTCPTVTTTVTHIPTDMKFKFVDDLSPLELLNLILIELSSYNFKHHVASDIGIDQLFLPSEKIKFQETFNKTFGTAGLMFGLVEVEVGERF